MQKYLVSYDWQDLAKVEIDEEKALPLLKEMIFFWTWGEDRLDDNEGDVVKTWLKQLGGFIIREDRLPNGDEGWTKLDGTHGVKAVKVGSWEYNEDDVEIKKQ